ncbi:hypothetical protein TBLA_0G00400 [Henningerozyma blattae CBS 6284]|uniref:NAD(P)H-hydrate epimerase n=1 Tax=Henningerozyma blattae (strain ATCC 34711 / CBS 6284 / DSM 70876 / NBRC 10599 / NRRL Y-10934 / UCD 77-7) TaxID=1071380 RepID=I2H6I7_HENB6|nr:hypothetical protein TBLA_0G00400 [Tetrapisispora blattae CBS 6284]CCH61989.1 hypothetical protein TBLA_0G00400 [Tetrapisispora blattae CBS 6284]
MNNFKVVSAKLAAELDKELMGPKVGYTLQQLMELAGLSVAQAVQHSFPPTATNSNKHILVLAGPGNNGGDGLVCARHLKLFGYNPVVYYPKRNGRVEFYSQLVHQLEFVHVPLLDDSDWLTYLQPDRTLCIVDALFGFSFKPPLREPFTTIMAEVARVQQNLPVVSVDVPSGWDVDQGPPLEETPASPVLNPKVLVSLTVPKPCSSLLKPNTIHYIGGRFVPRDFANKYGFEPFDYQGGDQVLRLQ